MQVQNVLDSIIWNFEKCPWFRGLLYVPISECPEVLLYVLHMQLYRLFVHCTGYIMTQHFPKKLFIINNFNNLQAQEEASKEEEQTEFTVSLTKFSEGSKIKLIKEIKVLMEGMNLVQVGVVYNQMSIIWKLIKQYY